MSLHKRRQFFIDRPIQSALLVRATLYWTVSLLVQLLLVFFFSIISSSPDSFYANSDHLWRHIQLAVVAAGLVLPMILLDIVKLSHRWVGPVFRLRTSLHALSRGEMVAPIRFREGDFWQELAGDFNVIATELNEHRGGGAQGSVAGTPAPASTDANA